MLYPNSMDRLGLPVTTLVGKGKVCIVMRTKNRPVLLARALSSVLAQRYQNWHLYLVNDAGESVIPLVNQYLGSFKNRLSLITKHTSEGMEAASNTALREALFFNINKRNYEFVCVHDDDDSWHPAFLEEMVAFLNKETKYVAAVSKHQLVYERVHNDLVFEESRTKGFTPDLILLRDMLKCNQFPPICLLIRVHAASQIGMFNEQLPVLGDWDYNIRLMMEGDIGVVTKELAYYHHRRSAKDSYGNTVQAGVDKHTLYTALYGNSMLRSLLQEHPGYAGLVHAMEYCAHEGLKTIQYEFNRLDTKIRDENLEMREHIRELDIHQDVIIHQLRQLTEKVSMLADKMDKRKSILQRLTFWRK